MKCSLGISDFLEDISSLSHSIVFLYFFALIAEEGFLISPCYSLELCIQMVYLFFSPLLLASLLFIAICKASSDGHFAIITQEYSHMANDLHQVQRDLWHGKQSNWKFEVISSLLLLFLVTQSCPILCNPMECSPPSSSLHGFPSHEYWSELPFPSLGDLADPGIMPRSPTWQVDSLQMSHIMVQLPYQHQMNTSKKTF